MRSLCRTLLALGGWWCVAGAHAQETEQEQGPDLDFLEYLGTWAEDDDEWFAIEQWQKDNREDGGEPSPEQKPKDEDEDDEGE